MAPSNSTESDKRAREGKHFIHKYCRMCALELEQGVFIFGDEGKRLHIPEKIRRTLAILVLEEDTLPKKICTDCCSSLEDYAQYKNTVLDAQEKLACIAKSITTSKSRQWSHTFDYEDSVVSSSESISDNESRSSSTTAKPNPERRQVNKIKSSELDAIPVKCMCGVSFTSERTLIAHYSDAHSGLKSQSPIIQCSKCSKISRKYKVIIEHYRRHHKNSNTSPNKEFSPARGISCKECGKRFHSNTELTNHIQCKHCDDIPSPSSSILISSVIDDDEGPGTTIDDVCPTPKQVESPQSPHPSFCPSTSQQSSNPNPKASVTTEYPDSHRETHRDIFNHYKLKRHEDHLKEQPLPTTADPNSSENKSSHPNVDASAKQSKDKISRKCDVCDKVLNSRAGYANHMLTHEGRRFVCKECGVSYTQKTTLDTHMKVHHLNVPKNFTCSVCQKKFIDFKALNRHQKIHSEPSVGFQCSFCQKTYTTDAYLQRHLRRHTQPPRHLCPTCGKAFFQKRKLDDHMFTHSGEKSQGCPFCHKCFSTNSNYVKHIKKKHMSELAQDKKIPPPRKVSTSKNCFAVEGNPNSQVPQSSIPVKSSHSSSSNAVQSQGSPLSEPQCQNPQPQSQNSPILAPSAPQSPPFPEPHHHAPPQSQQPLNHDYQENSAEPAHASSSYHTIAHQSSWGQIPTSSGGKNYQNPSGGNNNGNNANTMNALDLVDCAIHHALGSEGSNSSNVNIPAPAVSQPNHHSHPHLHGNNTSVLSIVHHQSEPMELSYKLDSNSNGFQDMPMELTKVFQRDPLELCVRQDFSNPLMDLSSRVVENGNLGILGGINMSNMNMNCGMGMGMSTNSYHKLDLTDRELMDMGAFRQPIDLISRADDGHQLCSEGSLVDLSLRSSFGQDQSASSFLRELIDLSARSDSFHGGELDLTKHPHHHQQHHHSVSNHHNQHHPNPGGSGGKASSSNSLQNVVYQDAMFSLQN